MSFCGRNETQVRLLRGLTSIHTAANPGFGEGRFVPTPHLPSLPIPSPPYPSPPLRTRTPLLRLGGLGERYKLPSGSGLRPAAKRFLVHFQPISNSVIRLLSAFWQAFSSKLSLVKLQLLTPPQFFRFFLSEMWRFGRGLPYPSTNPPSHSMTSLHTHYIPSVEYVKSLLYTQCALA